MTTETKVTHTPGPWRVQSRPNVMRVDVFGPKHADGGEYAPLVTFGDRSSLPDAYLIAAAPDMLEALEGLIAANNRAIHGEPAGWLAAWKRADAAIAKAKGGAA